MPAGVVREMVVAGAVQRMPARRNSCERQRLLKRRPGLVVGSDCLGLRLLVEEVHRLRRGHNAFGHKIGGRPFGFQEHARKRRVVFDGQPDSGTHPRPRAIGVVYLNQNAAIPHGEPPAPGKVRKGSCAALIGIKEGQLGG